MNIKSILVCINQLGHKQLAHACIDAEKITKDAKRTRQERHEACIRHLLILNAANERQWQEKHSNLQTTKD